MSFGQTRAAQPSGFNGAKRPLKVVHLSNLEQIPTRRNRVIRTGHCTGRHELDEKHIATYIPSRRDPPPPLSPPLIMWLFVLRGQNTLLGSNQLKTAPEGIATVDYTFVIAKEGKHKSTKHSRTEQDFRSLPSLLLVTGMLWTVRSLKQELVRTCSSTELRTQDWRS